ncbi:hypothetical protein BDW02DRAFT_468598, partial [Decorospora gaudefroyi]
MSKTKTKRARRQLKREGERKIAAHHHKLAKATDPKTNPQTTNAKTKQPPQKKQTPTPRPTPQASQTPQTPFQPYDHILLVGEGDFSFTHSLALTHGCAHLTSTSLDSARTLTQKYPRFPLIAHDLTALTPPVPLFHAIDACKLSTYKTLRCPRDDGQQGWDKIVFQFPHTGGLSTDVNRQVRSNQALLVDFFKSCLEISSPGERRAVLSSQQQNHTPTSTPTSSKRRKKPFLRKGGQILVSLFESEPYTLWNIRDLARHTGGLKVLTSFRFEWGLYPGYAHVRTLGALEGGGAWKGEERAARMYVFEKVELVMDSGDEVEMARLARRNRGGGLVSQKVALKRALE